MIAARIPAAAQSLSLTPLFEGSFRAGYNIKGREKQ